jgi:biotin operon repressor
MRLQKKIGISPRVVERHISKLKAEGILFLEEADNGASWVIFFAEDKSPKN